jgi:hypothetical protein
MPPFRRLAFAFLVFSVCDYTHLWSLHCRDFEQDYEYLHLELTATKLWKAGMRV